MSEYEVEYLKKGTGGWLRFTEGCETREEADRLYDELKGCADRYGGIGHLRMMRYTDEWPDGVAVRIYGTMDEVDMLW